VGDCLQAMENIIFPTIISTSKIGRLQAASYHSNLLTNKNSQVLSQESFSRSELAREVFYQNKIKPLRAITRHHKTCI
jgi:hypothetical protein